VQDEGLIEGHEQLKSYITNYYKGMFGPYEESLLFLDETLTNDIPQVSIEENGLLTAPYSEDEVQKAISKWNTIKHRVRMVFLMSFTKPSGRLLSQTF
jgi:hypothetical protein